MNPRVEQVLSMVQSAWRFRWLGLGCAWGVAILGWAAVLALPGRYDTEARIYINTASLLQPLLEGLTVTANTSNQLELVRRAVVGRPQLEHVIQTTGLKKRARTPAEREGAIADLMTSIRFTGDLQSRNFSIAYSDSDPKVSYSVVKSLLDAFVAQSVQANRTDSESAQKFLTQQLADYDKRLTESEKRLADFQRRNIGSMPDDRGGYFQRLQAGMADIDRLGAALSVATHRRDELRQRLLGGSPGSDSGAGSPSSSVDVRIAEARTRLDDMLLRFTEAHPDVIALKETITTLEEQRRQEIESLRKNAYALGSARAASTSPVTQNLQISLNEIEVELASIRAQMADQQHRVAELRASINTLPEVEAELTRLNRDYGTNKTQYDALLKRLESARLSERAERTQDVIFRVVDPPVQPLRPASPNRPLLAAGVFLAAMGSGVVLCYLLSLLRPVFLRVEELRKTFAGLKVLGGIENIQNSRDLARHRRGLVVFGSLTCGLVVALGAVVMLMGRWEPMRAALFGSGAA